jgi:hypothetical protein
MTWQNADGDSDPNKWPTASTRLNWARNNYLKSEYTMQQKLQKFLVQLMNMIALADLIEEEGGEAVVTPKQKRAWVEMYQVWRPTKQVGRPKNGSKDGPTE